MLRYLPLYVHGTSKSCPNFSSLQTQDIVKEHLWELDIHIISLFIALVTYSLPYCPPIS